MDGKLVSQYPPKPMGYDGYKCFLCNEIILKGAMMHWFKEREKNQQNCHADCLTKHNSGSKPDEKPSPTANIMEDQVREILAQEQCRDGVEMLKIKSQVYQHLAMIVKDDVQTSKVCSSLSDQIKGFVGHDICELGITPTLVDTIAMQVWNLRKNSSAEIDGVLIHPEGNLDVRGASCGSFQNPSAVKDECVSGNNVEQGVRKLLLDFPFFLQYATPSTVKLAYFYQHILGYKTIDELVNSKIYPETILRMFRSILPKELKHWGKEKDYREAYSPFANSQSMVDKRLLL